MKLSTTYLFAGVFLMSACGSDTTSQGDGIDANTGIPGTPDAASPVEPGWPLEPLACGDWAEGSQEDDDGATRDFYNRAARLAWRNLGGDWADANGDEQGEVAFALTTVSDDNTPQWQSWDVSNLVQGWQDATWANKGLLVRTPGGTYEFASREHANQEFRPELVVETAAGTQSIPALRDVGMKLSTFQGYGDSDAIRVTGTGDNVILSFDLSSFAGESITKATLRLYKLQDFGGGSNEVGVYRLTHGLERADSGPTWGIAAAYPDDENIEQHTSVLLSSDFESGNWSDAWSSGEENERFQRVGASEGNNFVPHLGQAMRIRFPAGDNYGGSLIYKYQDKTGAEPDEAFFRYYLRFGDNWQPTSGGKLPGVSGTYGRAGWGGRRVDGTDGWSARGSYGQTIPASNPLGSSVPIGNYVYHADMTGDFGDVDNWQQGCAGILEKGRWYSVETQVKLNTPGMNDGIIRGWVDGRLAYERIDWRFRDVDTLKVEQIWMNFYHGGTATPDQEIAVYIDNVVIADEYIGPMMSR